MLDLLSNARNAKADRERVPRRFLSSSVLNALAQEWPEVPLVNR